MAELSTQTGTELAHRSNDGLDQLRPRVESWGTDDDWAEEAFGNLIYWNEVDKGGHFYAWEQPQLFSAEVRAAFSPCEATLRRWEPEPNSVRSSR